MRGGWPTLLALIAQSGLLALLPVEVRAQEEDLEAPEEQVQPAGATRKWQAQAEAEAPKTSDRHELAVFYHQRAMAHQRLGNRARTIEDLNRALENQPALGKQQGGWGERWRMQNDLGNAYRDRGDRFAEIDHWLSVAQEHQRSNPFGYFYSQLRLMDVYGVLGQWVAADKLRQEADNMLPKLRSLPGWAARGDAGASAYGRYTGTLYSRQGNLAEAERRFRVGLESADRLAQARERALGADHQNTRAAAQGRNHAQRILAEALSTQGKYGEAEIVARAGLDEAPRLYGSASMQYAQALHAVGWSRFQQGDLAGAELHFRQALAVAEASGAASYSIGLAVRRLGLANAHLVQGRWPEALKLFEERDQGLRADAAQFKRTGSRHLGWAYVLHKTGQSPAAVDMAEAIIVAQIKRPVVNRWYVAQVRGVLGMALAGAGRTGEALKAFQQSIPELMRRDQEDATAEDAGFWRTYWQRAVLEGYLELLARAHAAGEATQLDLVDESFRIADMARGSGVQEAITSTAARAQIPDPTLADLARKEQDTLNRVVALNQLLARLAGAPEEQRLNKVIADMRAEIERLRKEHATLRADIRKRFPEYADLIDPRPVGIRDVAKHLRPGEALVSIYTADAQSYVWTVAAGGKAAFRVVPVRRAEVENDVRELRRAVDLGDGNPARLRAYDLARAHRLYGALLGPDDVLWKDAQVLNVIPHGALGELPFALLVTAAPSGTGDTAYREAQWLLRKVALAQLPSASAFAALRRAPPGKAQRQPFIGFGDPLFGAGSRGEVTAVRNLVVRSASGPAGAGAPTLATAFDLLGALPDTSSELKEIAAMLKADVTRDLFLDRQATEKNVKQARLANHRVVAFATHGVAPGEIIGLDQPALVLSNPALTGDTDNDGFLTMEEVLALKLDADWVVLSACNTASADGRGSEAVSGLGRAFFYAGARSLLVSNWAVETTSARLLTTELFRKQSENPALTRAEALRQSMLSLMEKKAAGGSGFSYAHPAFWAPFTLVGDGGR